MKKRRPSPRELTAFHEAAHALASHVLSWNVDKISIVATESFHGYTLRSRRQAIPGVVGFNIKKGEQPDDGLLANRLIVLYAGIVAERLLCTKRGVSSKPIRLGHDIREARESVRHLPQEEQLEILNAAEKHAVELLSDPQNWQVIERIATELLTFETLNGSSVRKLLPETQDISPYDALHHYVEECF